MKFKRVLVLGNSITIHAPDISIGWYGNWGMAASSEKSDYIHILAAKMNCDVKPVNISDWEGNHQSFNLSNLDPYFVSKPDLVILRLGENVKETLNFRNSLSVLIAYISSHNPDAKLLITGTFWKNEIVNDILLTVSNDEKIPFVSLDQLDNASNDSHIGAIVMDTNGLPRIIANQGIANHPGDSGMKAIATAIYTGLRINYNLYFESF